MPEEEDRCQTETAAMRQKRQDLCNVTTLKRAFISHKIVSDLQNDID